DVREARGCGGVLPALALPPSQDGRAHHRLPPRHRRLLGRELPAPGARADLLPRAAHLAHRGAEGMSLAEAISAVGPGPLTEDALRQHIFPLFSRTIARPGIYLANHSLGREVDSRSRDGEREERKDELAQRV